MTSDYLTDTYITPGSKFPPILWAEEPSKSKRTDNGPESFHAHFNEQLYVSHPSIYLFLDALVKLQTTTYIKVRNIDEVAPVSRAIKDKEQYLMEVFEKYQHKEISREQYVRKLGFKYQTN